MLMVRGFAALAADYLCYFSFGWTLYKIRESSSNIGSIYLHLCFGDTLFFAISVWYVAIRASFDIIVYIYLAKYLLCIEIYTARAIFEIGALCTHSFNSRIHDELSNFFYCIHTLILKYIIYIVKYNLYRTQINRTQTFHYQLFFKSDHIIYLQKM